MTESGGGGEGEVCRSVVGGWGCVCVCACVCVWCQALGTIRQIGGQENLCEREREIECVYVCV